MEVKKTEHTVVTRTWHLTLTDQEMDYLCMVLSRLATYQQGAESAYDTLRDREARAAVCRLYTDSPNGLLFNPGRFAK